jgi:hypothetical protein
LIRLQLDKKYDERYKRMWRPKCPLRKAYFPQEMLIRCFLLCSLLLYETWGRLKNPHPPEYEFEHKIHDLLDEALEPTEIHIIPDLRFNKYLDTINCRGRFRPESYQIIIISRIFTNRTVLEVCLTSHQGKFFRHFSNLQITHISRHIEQSISFCSLVYQTSWKQTECCT